jgi:hypothetical protein
MRYVLLTYNPPDARELWDEMTPSERRAEEDEYVRLVEEMGERKAYLAAVELEPSAATRTVRVRHGARSVAEGPASQSEESLTGYFLIDADSMEAAIDWAARIPNARNGSVEVRPVDEGELAERIAAAAAGARE